MSQGNNLYKEMAVADVDPLWFDVIVNKNIEDCRHSLDGLDVILKLPNGILSVDDVPEEWQAVFTAHEPYLTHADAKTLGRSPKYQGPPELD